MGNLRSPKCLSDQALELIVRQETDSLGLCRHNDMNDLGRCQAVTGIFPPPEALEFYPVHLTGVRRLPEAFPALTEGLSSPCGITNFVWFDASCQYDIPTSGTLKGYQISLDYLQAKARR